MRTPLYYYRWSNLFTAAVIVLLPLVIFHGTFFYLGPALILANIGLYFTGIRYINLSASKSRIARKRFNQERNIEALAR